MFTSSQSEEVFMSYYPTLDIFTIANPDAYLDYLKVLQKITFNLSDSGVEEDFANLSPAMKIKLLQAVIASVSGYVSYNPQYSSLARWMIGGLENAIAELERPSTDIAADMISDDDTQETEQL